jgi:acetylornithine deacetylase/succinyl-diaminopimelate desuccinylase-like protein
VTAGLPTSSVDRDRLVETASRMVDVHSFTGDEQGMAELMRELFDEMGLRCQWQQVEDGRANALGVWEGAGCTHVMLELWGEDRHEQIRAFAEHVLPHVRS